MMIARALVLCVVFALPTALTWTWVDAAASRLEVTTPGAKKAAVAASSHANFCNADLQKILRRVLQSCGLLGAGGDLRGCQPATAKSVATVSGDDFNALFGPMRERGAIVQFDAGKAELGPEDLAMIDQVFSDQRGAGYFLVVARASPDGSALMNSKLSRSRSEAVLEHLRKTFKDPDLDKEVGLLWLGEEFAQLDEGFCAWRRSGDPTQCLLEDVNRSAFIAWIDCRL